jgi:hypothetical protein
MAVISIPPGDLHAFTKRRRKAAAGSKAGRAFLLELSRPKIYDDYQKYPQVWMGNRLLLSGKSRSGCIVFRAKDK